jgi:hypothetical protein
VHSRAARTCRIPLAIPPDAKSVVVDARELHLILGASIPTCYARETPSSRPSEPHARVESRRLEGELSGLRELLEETDATAALLQATKWERLREDRLSKAWIASPDGELTWELFNASYDRLHLVGECGAQAEGE